jgi:enoyl-CoA hydratase/carnithine racemase
VLRFDDYATKYENIRMERHDGILEIAFHTRGGPLLWSAGVHRDFPLAFKDIASDRENKVIILTGTGDSFCAGGDIASYGNDRSTIRGWDRLHWEGQYLLQNLLDIEAPMVGAINGPALIHVQLALLCDIVLAADTTVIQDDHFVRGRTPGDGAHLVWPLLMGVNRARYFLLTGQKLSAREAQELGLVNEVLPPERLLPRAQELAEQLIRIPPLTLRYSRILLTQKLKILMQQGLGYGLALEAIGALDSL